MIHYTWYRSGSLFAMRYEMSRGSRLKEHAHTPDTLHNVCVLSGQIEFYGERFHRLSPGDIFDFDGSKLHTILAVEDSVIINYFLNGIPPGYAELPLSEHSGTIP